MNRPDHQADLQCAEQVLSSDGQDFSGAYMAVANLQYLSRQAADFFRPRTLELLAGVLAHGPHAGQRQAYFLHRKTAAALASLMTRARSRNLARHARRILLRCLDDPCDSAQRAACEALGALPLAWSDPWRPQGAAPASETGALPRVAWPKVLAAAGRPAIAPGRWLGRCFSVPLPRGRLLVVKSARGGEGARLLAREAAWMRTLRQRRNAFAVPFGIPRPLAVGGSDLFRPVRLPVRSGPRRTPRPAVAIGFIAPAGYFHYPNAAAGPHRLAAQEMAAVMARSARLLGQLAANGVVHTALIPLFHNRVQQDRRTDGGVYQWFRSGRLDRWLDSCRYPNIGVTGVRDFEHLGACPTTPRGLYEVMGTQLLSLALVAGSYFRAAEPAAVGLTADGRPVDARHLFDRPLLEGVLNAIYSEYYCGFTGRSRPGGWPLPTGPLAARMIEEMGVDRHMHETLRVADQQRMGDADFRDFLLRRGLPVNGPEALIRGRRDLTLTTGPHLGGFNQAISLPELIRHTGAAAALCISDLYWRSVKN